MTTLDTAPLDDGPSSPRSHTRAKTVFAFTATNIWLIGAFHGMEVRIGGLGWPLGYESWREYAKGSFPICVLKPGKSLGLREKFVSYAKERPTDESGPTVVYRHLQATLGNP